MHIVFGKLDNRSARKWEQSRNPDELPKLQDFLSFIKRRANVLELLEKKNITDYQPNQPVKKPFKPFSAKPQLTRSMKASFTVRCSYCGGENYVQNCTTLINIPVNERMTSILNANLCINCLRGNHQVDKCKSTYSCRHCRSRHDSLLHLDNTLIKPTNNCGDKETATTLMVQSVDTVIAHHHAQRKVTILPTALVLIKNRVVHALLDSGSQANFITQRLAADLNINLTEANVIVTGIGETKTQTKHECDVIVHSRLNAFNFSANCLVTSKISSSFNAGTTRETKLQIPPNLVLADPNFMNASEADLLIGSEHFWQLLSVDQHSIGYSGAILQKTRLGWVVAGKIHLPISVNNASCHLTLTRNSNHQAYEEMLMVWEQGDRVTNRNLSIHDGDCVAHFEKTHIRNADGRFVVEVPFKESLATLGESYQAAKRRLLSLERKLANTLNLKTEYHKFMKEYLVMGHMSPSSGNSSRAYYLPHHCIVNENSETTKLRVVFGGSALATCGTSINTHQYVGPRVQDDLFNLLLRFRTCKYVVTADIGKMFRQVLVKEEQRCLQRILFRFNETEPIQSFDLNTVTYGTAAAAFLATYSLDRLAKDIETSNERLAYYIRQAIYVDDFIAGFDTIEDAIDISTQIFEHLRAGKFVLRKWASNSHEINDKLTNSVIGEDEGVKEYNFDHRAENKTLGLQWSREQDFLSIAIPSLKSTRITKRTILSEVASIFDPLGLVCPCTVIAKIIIQVVWST